MRIVMPRKLSPEHELELELYRILKVFADFIDQLMPDLGAAASAGINRAYAECDLRGLRMARGDMIAMAQAVSVDERRRLDVRLRAEAGVSLEELSVRDVQRIGPHPGSRSAHGRRTVVPRSRASSVHQRRSGTVS